MSIILNEYKWAEDMINRCNLGNKPVETLNRVAKYYIATGNKKSKIRAMLEAYMTRCDPNINLPAWSDTLDKVVKYADKSPLIRLDGVDITTKEFAYIKDIEHKQSRRLAFTLLCLAKYWDAVSDQNNHWVNNPDREIMRMANINTSIKRQSLMFHELREAGLIRFSKKVDNLNVQVAFIEPGETAIHISEFRNLGYQCLMYCGEPYIKCVSCGLTVKIQNPSKGRKPKYCPNCAVAMHQKQKAESAVRRREAVV